MGNLKALSPLAGALGSRVSATYKTDGLSFKEVTDYGLIRGQLFNRGEQSIEAVAANHDLDMPTACQFVRSGESYLLWSAPGEWLVAVETGTEISRAERLSQQLTDTLAAVTVVSESRVVIRLQGRRARDLLGIGSGADFHPSVFKAGTCITTKFAHIAAMVAQPNESEEFLILADRSSAYYLWEWLVDNAG